LSVGEDPEAAGHIGVVIPYVVYRKLASHLVTTGSHVRVEELIIPILEVHAERLGT